MSRKANISATEKAAFGRPRLYAVRAHYGPLDKQPDQFSGAVVVLDDEGACIRLGRQDRGAPWGSRRRSAALFAALECDAERKSHAGRPTPSTR